VKVTHFESTASAAVVHQKFANLPRAPGLLIGVRIPVHRGQSFRRIADSVPVIADSFR
jgi:hypothetical protein